MYNQIKKQSQTGAGAVQKIKQRAVEPVEAEFKPNMFKTIQSGLSPQENPVDINDIGFNDNMKSSKKPQTSTMGEDPIVPAEDNDINMPHNLRSNGLMKRQSNPMNPSLQNVSADINEPFLSKLSANENEDLLANEELNNLINPVLFVRGVPSESFYLILTGKVMICSGNEGVLLEQQPFNYMGTECLTNDNYVPDFSAKVVGKAKLLKISRQDYRRSLAHVNNNS